MMNIKKLILKVIHKSNKSLFCFVRNFLEYFFFNQDFSLFYIKEKYYLRN